MKTVRFVIVMLLACLLTGIPAAAQNADIDLTGRQAAVFDAAMLADLENYIREAMDEYSITGAAVAIVQNGGDSTYLRTFGTTGEDGRHAINTDTRFMIGSTTKSMTTLLMAQLVDEGLMGWNTRLIDVLPEFALANTDVTAQIRVRDLFNMGSGLPRYDLPRHLFALTPQDTFYWLTRTPLVSSPGEAYHYNNSMVAAGGWLAAILTGTPFEGDLSSAFADLMQNRVFDPIGMERTTLELDEALTDANHALGYGYDIMDGTMVLNEAPDVVLSCDVMPIAPAGAVWASISDMAAYIAVHMNGGVTASNERLVSSENLAITHAGETPVAPGVLYGLGWMRIDVYGQPILTHGGSTAGFSADMTFLPEGNLGIVILNNRSLANNFKESVRAYIIEQAFTLDHTAADLYRRGEAMLNSALQDLVSDWQPVDVTTVDAYTGDYEFGIQLRVEGDQFLMRTVIGDVPLLQIGDTDQFVMVSRLSPNRVTFAEQDGVMTMTLETLFNLDSAPQVMTLGRVQ